MGVEITLDDGGLGDRFGNCDAMLEISTNDGLRDLGRLIVPHKGTGPLADATPKRTGKLRGATILQVLTTGGNQKVEIRQGARTPGGSFYGHFVREGTNPHVIVPRRANVLSFVWHGQQVFFKRVNHPGNAPNRYHERVYRKLAVDIDRIITRMGVTVTKYLSGSGGRVNV